MADHSSCKPLEPSSIKKAHDQIKQYIHETPLLTNRTLDTIASSSKDGLQAPKIRLHFKCENMQRIGAFKARGAFHAVMHLIEEMGLEEVRRRGVITHSSGNHAQALALAASTFSIPSYIIMPSISTPSKIAGTRAYTPNVIFSGSTSDEREAKVAEVIKDTNAILVPPYDHPDIMLGQGTAAYEMDKQFRETHPGKTLDVVLAPCGGGGLLSGTVIYFSDKPETKVFGGEPSYQGANDAERGLAANPPTRITTVKSLTIADGVRTPVGELPWKIFTTTNSTKKFLEGIYSVSEEEIKDAMRLVMERMKVFVEPSAVVPLAVVLYNQAWRKWAVGEQKDGEVWDVGIILSGGNTTMEAIARMFGGDDRAAGKVGLDGERKAENVAG